MKRRYFFPKKLSKNQRTCFNTKIHAFYLRVSANVFTTLTQFGRRQAHITASHPELRYSSHSKHQQPHAQRSIYTPSPKKFCPILKQLSAIQPTTPCIILYAFCLSSGFLKFFELFFKKFPLNPQKLFHFFATLLQKDRGAGPLPCF